MTHFAAEIREAYDALLEDGVMGQVRAPGRTGYNPALSTTNPGTPAAVNVPMLRGQIAANVRYLPGSLISDNDIRLYLAAITDTGQPFILAMGLEITFNGDVYLPTGFEAVAPDGVAIMYDAIVSKR